MWLGHIMHALPYFDALYAVLVTDPDRRYSHGFAVLPRRSRALRRFAPELRQLLQCRKKFHKPRSPNSQPYAAKQGLASPL
jgi:hypothetical protein